MTKEELKNVLDILKKNNIGYMKADNQAGQIEIKMSDYGMLESASAKTPEPIKDAKETAAPAEEHIETYDVKSKYVGRIYRNKKPNDAPLIKLREIIKKEQTIAYINCMGIIQEVKSDQEGKIVEILVEEGQVVEYGQPLFRLNLKYDKK